MSSRERSETPEDIRELKQANDERLRNAFDEIIEKYAHDFTEVGDEVDIITGEIVVNNGHIERMQDEQDTGLSTVSVSKMAQLQYVSDSEEDGWEDLDEDETGNMDMKTAVDGFVNSLLDELASDKLAPTSRQTSKEFSHSQSPGSDIPQQPNSGPKRINQTPAASAKAFRLPREQSPDPAFDPQIVQSFANNIANQITDFLMAMAKSIRQQHASGPPLADLGRKNTEPQDLSRFLEPPKKLQVLDEGTRIEGSTSVTRNYSPMRAPLVKSRLHALKSNAKSHGHRGKTPGMPSLWSEDDTDYGHRRKRKKTESDLGSSLAQSKPRKPSGLRNDSLRQNDGITNRSPGGKLLARLLSEIPEFPQSDSERNVVSPSTHPQGFRRLGKGNDNEPGSDAESEEEEEEEERRRERNRPKKKYHKRLKKPFTSKDDTRMIEMYYQGLNWNEISAQFPGTSHNQIRYHFTKNLEIGNSGTYAPRPDIFTPPQSPRSEAQNQADPKDLSKESMAGAESVSFATAPTPIVASHSLMPGSQQAPHLVPHQPLQTILPLPFNANFKANGGNIQNTFLQPTPLPVYHQTPSHQAPLSSNPHSNLQPLGTSISGVNGNPGNTSNVRYRFEHDKEESEPLQFVHITFP